jgi:hypothetical protein
MKTRHHNSKTCLDQGLRVINHPHSPTLTNLALTLLVASISRADHAHGTVATDDLAVSANLLD